MAHLTDIEIAQQAKMQPITQIAAAAGIDGRENGVAIVIDIIALDNDGCGDDFCRDHKRHFQRAGVVAGADEAERVIARICCLVAARLDGVGDIDAVKVYGADKVAVGDTVVEAAKRFNLGTVTAVSCEPYVKDVFDEATGEMVAATHPDYITLNVTLTADGYYADGSYYINGSKVAVGVGVSIHARNFAGTGYVSAMRLK